MYLCVYILNKLKLTNFFHFNIYTFVCLCVFLKNCTTSHTCGCGNDLASEVASGK